MSQILCIGCGGSFPDVEGTTHPYMKSTPGCWKAYGEVLAREYSDFRYNRVHRLTVDSYAVQHPGRPSRQSISSVAVHLMSLCAVLESDADLSRATALLQQAVQHKDRYGWLTPPESMGKVTVADVVLAVDPSEHDRRVREWARSAWSAWSEHHGTVRKWLDQIWS